MVDSRAKNMFLNLYTDGLWYPVFYDLDTAIGLNNEGVNDFNFDIETHDVIGTEKVFNGNILYIIFNILLCIIKINDNNWKENSIQNASRCF